MNGTNGKATLNPLFAANSEGFIEKRGRFGDVGSLIGLANVTAFIENTIMNTSNTNYFDQSAID
jgi:hypothetical protein